MTLKMQGENLKLISRQYFEE